MKLLKSQTVRVIKPRREVKDVILMKEISKTLERNAIKDGYYTSAKFRLGDKTYLMDAVGNLYVWVEQSAMLVAKKVSFCKGGLYPAVSLSFDGKVYNIMAYKLSLLCLTDWFLESYLSDDGLVVNHCIVERKKSYIAGKQYYTRPVREFSFNPRSVELVTYSQNRQVARFIEELNLFDVYVSAYDMIQIYKYMQDERSKGSKLSDKALVKGYYELQWGKSYFNHLMAM